MTLDKQETSPGSVVQLITRGGEKNPRAQIDETAKRTGEVLVFPQQETKVILTHGEWRIVEKQDNGEISAIKSDGRDVTVGQEIQVIKVIEIGNISYLSVKRNDGLLNFINLETGKTHITGSMKKY
ncbi:hypothetical protein N9J72_00955 [Candidatus Gracilibacteria bacterium]|nr:hypothetical protein [Candidatus Gracilibacteria bacterium]